METRRAIFRVHRIFSHRFFFPEVTNESASDMMGIPSGCRELQLLETQWVGRRRVAPVTYCEDPCAALRAHLKHISGCSARHAIVPRASSDGDCRSFRSDSFNGVIGHVNLKRKYQFLETKT